MRDAATMNEMAEHARVSAFMPDEPVTVGRWMLKPFSVTEHEARMQRARAIGEGGPNMEARLERTIPEGDYISLLRKGIPGELQDIEDGEIVDAYSPEHPEYIPIMSDTPTEIFEHGHAFRHATGRVLITGLGLGCLVEALLSQPDVTEIVVIEIDRDVLALTGKYYSGHERVTLVNADALKWCREYDGPRFNYAWHDIWSHIADRNLEDDSLAEHGISYGSMFMACERFVDKQGAWAYREALEMRERKREQQIKSDQWGRQFVNATTDDERVELLIDFHVHRLMPGSAGLGEPVPQNIREFFIEQMDLRNACYVQLKSHPEMVDDIKAILDRADEPDDPMHRPNEAPEANVA